MHITDSIPLCSAVAVVFLSSLAAGEGTPPVTIGPQDWLDSGVRMLTEEDHLHLFGTDLSHETLDWLHFDAADDLSQPTTLFRTRVILTKDGPIFEEDAIGIFVQTSQYQRQLSTPSSWRVQIVDGHIVESDIPENFECGWEPLCQIVCEPSAELRVKTSSIAGDLTLFSGETVFLLGRQVESEWHPHDSAEDDVSQLIFAPQLSAVMAPICQDAELAGEWTRLRSRAEAGETDFEPAEIDALYTMLLSPPGVFPLGPFIQCPHCVDNYQQCIDDAWDDYRIERKICGDGPGTWMSLGYICGGGFGGAAGGSMVCPVIGTFVGACVGVAAGYTSCIVERNTADDCKAAALNHVLLVREPRCKVNLQTCLTRCLTGVQIHPPTSQTN